MTGKNQMIRFSHFVLFLNRKKSMYNIQQSSVLVDDYFHSRTIPDVTKLGFWNKYTIILLEFEKSATDSEKIRKRQILDSHLFRNFCQLIFTVVGRIKTVEKRIGLVRWKIKFRLIPNPRGRQFLMIIFTHMSRDIFSLFLTINTLFIVDLSSNVIHNFYLRHKIAKISF